MGRKAPVPYTRVAGAAGNRTRAFEPRLVLRRSAPAFFGKTVKLSTTVTTPPAAAVPRSPRLPRVALVAALVAGIGSAVSAPPGATSVYGRRLARAVAAGRIGGVEQPTEDAGQAERILATSLAMLAQTDSFSARLRQKVRIGDQVLVGTGSYVQSGRGEDQRYFFDSMLKSDTETFTLVEVCDGLFAWSNRHYGTDPPQLERLDVRRVREKLAQLKAADPSAAAVYLGGLQRSLGTLRQWFRFETARPGDLAGTPVWILDGRWIPDWLRLIAPDLAAAAIRPGGITPAELPDGVPWSVRFFIGRADFVPYRVEWLALPGRRPVAAGEPELVGVLELLDVRIGGPIDAGKFVYKPAAEGLVDMTDMHVAGLGLLRR